MKKQQNVTPTSGCGSITVGERTADEDSADSIRFSSAVDPEDRHVVVCGSGYVDVYLTNVHGVTDHVRIRSIR